MFIYLYYYFSPLFFRKIFILIHSIYILVNCYCHSVYNHNSFLNTQFHTYPLPTFWILLYPLHTVLSNMGTVYRASYSEGLGFTPTVCSSCLMLYQLFFVSCHTRLMRGWYLQTKLRSISIPHPLQSPHPSPDMNQRCLKAINTIKNKKKPYHFLQLLIMEIYSEIYILRVYFI